jgi:hypothetical protein
MEDTGQSVARRSPPSATWAITVSISLLDGEVCSTSANSLCILRC